MTAVSLDNYANYSTPPITGAEKPSALKLRHRLRRLSGKIIGNRTFHCGRTATGENITLVRSPQGSAHYQGVVTCGSVWACPVCAAKIAARRQNEIEELVQAHHDAGGSVYLLTLTVRHGAAQSLHALRGGVMAAWGKMTAGNPWARLRDRFNMVGWVRCMEVTHGANGWHPHIHCLVFTSREIDRDQMHGALWARWSAKVENEGLGVPDIKGFDLTLINANSADAAARYVAKWGCGAELSMAAEKQGKGGNRSPWQILADAARSGADQQTNRDLWKTYTKAFHGKRHLMWSKGLREIYGLRASLDDLEAAATEGETEPLQGLDDGVAHGRVGLIDGQSWKKIVAKKITAEVLEVTGRDGYGALVQWLTDRHGISIHGRGPAHWAGRTLPQMPPPNPESREVRERISDHHTAQFLKSARKVVA